MGYLNNSGLSRVWDKIKSLFVSKKSIDYAGITDKIYTTIGEQSVTTSVKSYNDNPYAKLTSLTSFKPEEGKRYRVTFEGNEYELSCVSIPVRYIRNNSHASQIIQCIGNVTLYNNGTGNPGITYDVPFLIVNRVMGANGIPSSSAGPFIFTSEASTVSVKIEEITYQGSIFPHYLIDGTNIDYVRVDKDGLNFPTISIGENRVLHLPGIFAIGLANEITSSQSYAFGYANGVSGQSCIAIGVYNEVSSSVYGIAIGASNTVSGAVASAIGYQCESSGTASLATGIGTIANHLGQTTSGLFNVADTSSNGASSFGDYLEIVGNGTSKSARSNARMLGTDGTEYLAGGLVLGYGTQNQNTLTPAQLGLLVNSKGTVTLTTSNLVWDASRTSADYESDFGYGEIVEIVNKGLIPILRLETVMGYPLWLYLTDHDPDHEEFIFNTPATFDENGKCVVYNTFIDNGGAIPKCTVRKYEILIVPSSGTTGQVLTKTANGYAWQSLPTYNGSVS